MLDPKSIGPELDWIELVSSLFRSERKDDAKHQVACCSPQPVAGLQNIMPGPYCARASQVGRNLSLGALHTHWECDEVGV